MVMTIMTVIAIVKKLPFIKSQSTLPRLLPRVGRVVVFKSHAHVSCGCGFIWKRVLANVKAVKILN